MKKDWKPLAAQVSKILWEDWDPIGVNDAPEARNEYDGYALGIAGLIIHGADADDIAKRLRDIEIDMMGLLSGSTRVRESVARKLADLSANGV